MTARVECQCQQVIACVVRSKTLIKTPIILRVLPRKMRQTCDGWLTKNDLTQTIYWVAWGSYFRCINFKIFVRSEDNNTKLLWVRASNTLCLGNRKSRFYDAPTWSYGTEAAGSSGWAGELDPAARCIMSTHRIRIERFSRTDSSSHKNETLLRDTGVYITENFKRKNLLIEASNYDLFYIYLNDVGAEFDNHVHDVCYLNFNVHL